MTPREYCNTHKPVAYYSGYSGLEIHGMEYGINDYILCKSRAWTSPSKYRYHRRRVYHTRGGRAFFVIDGRRVHLDECIRI